MVIHGNTQVELDPDDGAGATNDGRLEIGMGDMGTIGVYVSEGGLDVDTKVRYRRS